MTTKSEQIAHALWDWMADQTYTTYDGTKESILHPVVCVDWVSSERFKANLVRIIEPYINTEKQDES